MRCNLILAFLTIARLAEVDWDATGIEWFPFEYERSKFISILPVSRVTRKGVDEKEAT